MVFKGLKSRYVQGSRRIGLNQRIRMRRSDLGGEDWSKLGAIWGGVVRLLKSVAGICKTWLAPLIITIMIFAALFFFFGRSIDIPLLYRSAK